MANGNETMFQLSIPEMTWVTVRVYGRNLKQAIETLVREKDFEVCETIPESIDWERVAKGLLNGDWPVVEFPDQWDEIDHQDYKEALGLDPDIDYGEHLKEFSEGGFNALREVSK